MDNQRFDKYLITLFRLMKRYTDDKGFLIKPSPYTIYERMASCKYLGTDLSLTESEVIFTNANYTASTIDKDEVNALCRVVANYN